MIFFNVYNLDSNCRKKKKKKKHFELDQQHRSTGTGLLRHILKEENKELASLVLDY
jgi:hypothetical protein